MRDLVSVGRSPVPPPNSKGDDLSVDERLGRLADRISDLEKQGVALKTSFDLVRDEQHRWNTDHRAGFERMTERVTALERRVYLMAGVGGCVGAMLPHLIRLVVPT